jgi:hypothetical protein
MAVFACARCGKEGLGLTRGRRRRFCSDQCRHAAHRERRRRGRGQTARRAGGVPAVPATSRATTPGGLQAWAGWVRSTYVLDRTGEELVRLVLEAEVRYQQARKVLDAEGLTTPAGRSRPEVAVERDTRAALARLIQQLNLEDTSDDETEETAAGGDGERRRGTRRA